MPVKLEIIQRNISSGPDKKTIRSITGIGLLIIIFLLLSCATQESFRKKRASEFRYKAGLTLFIQKQYQQALEEFNKALENDPDSYEAHNGKGMTYLAIGMIDRAEDEFKKALELKKDYTDAMYNLGYLYIIKKRYKDASKLFERIIKDPLYRNTNAALSYLGWCYHKMNNDKKAIETINKAIKRLRSFCMAYKLLAKIFVDRKDLDNAEKNLMLYKKYCNQIEEPYLLLYDFYKRFEKGKKVNDILNECIDNVPQNDSCRRLIERK